MKKVSLQFFFIFSACALLQNGDSPLHIAAAMGRKKLTKIILESAPDLALLNQQKETALEIAKRKGHQDCDKDEKGTQRQR